MGRRRPWIQGTVHQVKIFPERIEMNRRDFLSQGFCGIIGTGIAASHFGDPEFLRRLISRDQPGQDAERLAAQPPIKYRTLGRTGLKVCEVGMGAMITSDPAVIAHALDLGINYIDTADCYQGGNNEKMIGRLLRSRRDKVIIATKVHLNPMKKMMESAEKSLKSLETDHIDVMQIHGLGNEKLVNYEEAKKALSKLKEQGKIRFAGVSTHSRMPEVIRAVARSNFYDMVLTTYNFHASEDLKTAIAEARKAGVGIVAMKIMAGGYKAEKLKNLNPFQAALKWVLSDKNVDTTIPSATSIEQATQNFNVMGSSLNFSDRKTLKAYGDEISRYYCRMCGVCGQVCARGVRFADVLRFLMYAEGYRQSEMAREHYFSLADSERAEVCLSCSRCTIRCAHRLNIRDRMLHAHRVFA